MLKPLLILKPSIPNALFPSFLKNFTYTFLIMLFIGLINYSLISLNLINNFLNIGFLNFLIWILIISIIISIFPLTTKIIVLLNTSYNFYNTHITKEFEFIVKKKESIPYTHIVNITIDISLWDRFCNTGDIHLKTADDSQPDILLEFMKNPNKLEHTIYHLIHKNTHKQH
ncbi:MAG: PH domain-containing protein [Candidatus Woesearchaeota archaeon]